MTLLTPKQIARRSVLARDAVYQRADTHGAGRSHATRVIHLLLLVSVIHQLISSQFIERPLPGDAPSTLFGLHEYIGMASLGIVLVFWIWTLVRHGETKVRKLFPWFSIGGIGAVIADVLGHIKAARRADFSYDGTGDLASAVHGLGLLVVTAMAATGTVYFVTTGTSLARYALDLHGAIANFMWAYLIGHAGIALLHHLLGSDILRRMFWIRRGITITTPRRGQAYAKRDKIEA